MITHNACQSIDRQCENENYILKAGLCELVAVDIYVVKYILQLTV